jgi:hypothetical protein
MKLKIVVSLIFIVLSSLLLFAQNSDGTKEEKDTTTKKEKKSYFTVSTAFDTNSTFLGRAEQTFYPTADVMIGYNFKSGIYLNGEVGFAPTQPVLFGGIDLTGGYEFSIIKDLLSVDLNYTHYFAQNQSKVSSEIQGTANGIISVDLDWINLQLTPSYIYRSSIGDALFSVGASKEIHLFAIGKDSITITPGIKTYAGTQKLLELHVNNPKRAKTKAAIAALNAQYDQLYSKFNYLDTDIELPISFTLKSFTFELTPTLSLPINLVTKTQFIANPFFIDFTVTIEI